MWSPKAKTAPFGSWYILLKAIGAQVAQTLRGLQEKLNVASVKIRVFQRTQEGWRWHEKPWRSKFSDPASTQMVVTTKKVTLTSSSSCIQWMSPPDSNNSSQSRFSGKAKQGILAIFWPWSNCCYSCRWGNNYGIMEWHFSYWSCSGPHPAHLTTAPTDSYIITRRIKSSLIFRVPPKCGENSIHFDWTEKKITLEEGKQTEGGRSCNMPVACQFERGIYYCAEDFCISCLSLLVNYEVSFKLHPFFQRLCVNQSSFNWQARSMAKDSSHFYLKTIIQMCEIAIFSHL